MLLCASCDPSVIDDCESDEGTRYAATTYDNWYLIQLVKSARKADF